MELELEETFGDIIEKEIELITMSWRKIPMKFPGTCIVCNEKIEVNEIGLWAKGIRSKT